MKEKKIKNRENLTEKLKDKRGITLIALVITIVVLLILAGVSIAMLTGENGILTQAQKAKNETENATKNEEGILNDYEDKINEALGRKEQAEPGKYYETDTEVELGGKELTIPGGASISKIPGEYESIDNGLVIYITNKQLTDEEWQDIETMQTTYDQFVWIPVTNGEEYKRNVEYEQVRDSQAAITPNGYLPEKIQPIIEEGKTPEEIGKINEEAERNAVVKAKGFYISRYEIGKVDGEPVSRKGVNAYIYTGYDEISTISKDYMKDTNNLNSALCTGIQWDVIMSFVNGKLDGNNEVFDVKVANKNRHKGRTTSGQNESDKVCNIYDLEDNYWEFVAEGINRDGEYKDSQRGGDYHELPGIFTESYPASFRMIYNATITWAETFRIALYII